MKKVLFLLCFLFFCICSLPAQTVFYNGGTDVTLDAGAIIYVDGDIVNRTGGLIHNKGDIYFTRDWTNNEPSGCLDPTTGTVILDGTGIQTIQGTVATTFNNLDCQNGSQKTISITTIVGGNTGTLSLNSSALELNSSLLIVTNPLPAAITRTSGYIISETGPSAGYGTIQWNMGNSTGNYIYPFGTTGGTYIPFVFNVTTAGIETTTGSMSVATYPTPVTSNPNNRPLPTTVGNLDDPTGNEAAPVCADRYWITDTSNYSMNPVANFTFSYTDSEWDNSGGSTNIIAEDSLRAWRWNGAQWTVPLVGTDNSSSNTVTVLSANTSFSVWTLRGVEPPPPPPCGDFFLPTAFSPNGDGKNDVFKPRNICIQDINFKIYNRWGNLVFESIEATRGWDGSTLIGEPGNAGVYAYELKATLFDGTLVNRKGTVSLLK